MKAGILTTFFSFCMMLSNCLFATTSVDDNGVPYGNYVAEIIKITAVSDNNCMASFIDGINNKKLALDFKKDPSKIGNISNIDNKQFSEAGKDNMDLAEISQSFEVLSLDCELTKVGDLPSNIEQAIAKGETETRISIDEDKIVLSDITGEQVFKYTKVNKEQGVFIFVSESGKTIKLSAVANGLKLFTESTEYLLKRIN